MFSSFDWMLDGMGVRVKTLDGYIRVSRVMGREGDSYISPDVQREQIERWAATAGVDIDRWFIDEDQTGGNMDRPQFTKMMARVYNGKTEGVVVARIDRFSRNDAEAHTEWARMKAAGAVFVDASMGGELPPEVERLYRGLMVSFATWQREQIGGGWNTARSRAVERGIQIGRAPVGYEKHDGHLVPNSSAEHIRRAFEMRKQGETLVTIAAYLSEYTSPGRGNKFVSTTVKALLRNRTYLGEVRSGDYVNEQAHEPIVSRELFDSVQSERRATRHKGDHLLTGLVRCAGCRHSLRRIGRVNPALDGDYRCAKHHVAGECPDPSIVNQPEIERHVEREFLKRVKKLPAHGDFRDARAALEAAQRALDEFRDDTEMQLALGADAFLAGIKKRKENLTRAELDYGAAVATSDGVDARMVAEKWKDMTGTEKREALASLIDAVFVRPGEKIAERVHICWRGEAPELPSRGHHPSELAAFVW